MAFLLSTAFATSIFTWFLNKLSNNFVVTRLDKCLAYIITHYRGIFSVFVLLPLSFFVDILFNIKNRYDMYTNFNQDHSASAHREKVLSIQSQILEFLKQKDKPNGKRKLCTSRPGWKAMSMRVGKYKNSSLYFPIDLSTLNSIVSIDLSSGTVFLEPNVTMGQLSSSLLPLGYSIPVLPELDDLTVGGLICGMGIESSSHIYGLFQYIAISYEIVLANKNADIIQCSGFDKDKIKRELFYNIPMSYGTLGMLVGCTLKLKKIKHYIRLEYLPCFSKSEAMSIFTKESLNEKYDFIECLAYSTEKYVVMRGEYADLSEQKTKAGKLNKIGLWYKPWFFKHVEGFLNNNNNNISNKDNRIEYIPLRDYYHRHTKSLFWEIQDILSFGNNIIFRLLFGWLMPLNVSLLKRTQTEEIGKLYDKHHVVQDMLVPIETLSKSLNVIDNYFNVYPLWLCPMKICKNKDNIKGFVYPSDEYLIKNNNNGDTGGVKNGIVNDINGGSGDTTRSNDNGSRGGRYNITNIKDGPVECYTSSAMYVDIGIYGNVGNKEYKAVETTRKVEKYVIESKGFQMLYADTFTTRDEFREMYDHSVYDKLRKKLGCHGIFPTVYDKVNKKARK